MCAQRYRTPDIVRQDGRVLDFEMGEEGAEGLGLGCDGGVVLVVFEVSMRGCICGSWIGGSWVGELRLAIAWHVVEEDAVGFGELG